MALRTEENTTSKVDLALNDDFPQDGVIYCHPPYNQPEPLELSEVRGPRTKLQLVAILVALYVSNSNERNRRGLVRRHDS